MAEIDTQKDVYLFLHGRIDLKEKATNACNSSRPSIHGVFVMYFHEYLFLLHLMLQLYDCLMVY